MQFVHLGGRTGTLSLEAGEERAEIGFHQGKIISAWTPRTRRLGDSLLAARLITEEDLLKVLERQETERPRVPFGQLLLTMGVVDKAQLQGVITSRIEEAIYDIVTWRHGNFNFVLDELKPIDETSLYPGDLVPDINLNTQMVILEALRIFDEKNRDGVETPPTEDWNVVEALFEPETGPSETAETPWPNATEGLPTLRIQLVTACEEMRTELRELLDGMGGVVEIEPWEAGLAPPGEISPIVLMDLRDPRVSVRDLEFVKRTHERASLVAVLSEETSLSEVYKAGVVAAVPDDPVAVSACVRNIAKIRRSQDVKITPYDMGNPGFARLQRVVADLRSGLLSATVALNLMQVISENVERAIMFSVRGGELVAAGAFGFSSDAQPLSLSTRGERIPLTRAAALGQAIRDGQTRSVRFEEVHLPSPLAEKLGRPRTGQSVIFPVIGRDRVIAVVYTDNGDIGEEIRDIEIVELAAAQVGVAFENEILRRKLEQASAHQS